MRYLSTIIVLIASNAIASQAVPALDKDELKAFCNNKQLWSNFDVAPEKCIEVAEPCSKNIADSGETDLVKASQQLYSCVFDGLNINIPQ